MKSANAVPMTVRQLHEQRIKYNRAGIDLLRERGRDAWRIPILEKELADSEAWLKANPDPNADPEHKLESSFEPAKPEKPKRGGKKNAEA